MGWSKKDEKIRAIVGLEWSIYGVDVVFDNRDEWDKATLRGSLRAVCDARRKRVAQKIHQLSIEEE